MQVKVDCGRAGGALVVKLGELELSWSQQMRTCSEAKGWTRVDSRVHGELLGKRGECGRRGFEGPCLLKTLLVRGTKAFTMH